MNISTVIPGPNCNQATSTGSCNQGEGANKDDAADDAAGLPQLPQPQILTGPTYSKVQDMLGDLEQLWEMLKSKELPKLPWEALEELQVIAREVEEEMQEATRQPLLGLTIGQLSELYKLQGLPQALWDELEHLLKVHTKDEDEEPYEALDESTEPS